MKLFHLKNICNSYSKKKCQGCPGSFNGRCMFGPRPPMEWSHKEISHFVLKVQEGKENGSNSKRGV